MLETGTKSWLKRKGAWCSAKYLIKFVRLVLFLNVSFVFDQKRMILLCLTRRERFCFVWPKENDSVCCIWPEENASVLTVNASNRQRPPRPGQQHEGLCWSSGCKYALSSLLNCSLASLTAACFQYHCSTNLQQKTCTEHYSSPKMCSTGPDIICFVQCICTSYVSYTHFMVSAHALLSVSRSVQSSHP